MNLYFKKLLSIALIITFIPLQAFSQQTCRGFFGVLSALTLEPMTLDGLSKDELAVSNVELLYLARQTAFPKIEEDTVEATGQMNLGKTLRNGWTLEFEYTRDARHDRDIYILTSIELVAPNMQTRVIIDSPLNDSATQFSKRSFELDLPELFFQEIVRVPLKISDKTLHILSKYYHKLKYVPIITMKQALKKQEFWKLDLMYSRKIIKDFFLGEYFVEVVKQSLNFLFQRLGVVILVALLGGAFITVDKAKDDIQNAATQRIDSKINRAFEHQRIREFLNIDYIQDLNLSLNNLASLFTYASPKLGNETRSLQNAIIHKLSMIKDGVAPISSADTVVFGPHTKPRFLLSVDYKTLAPKIQTPYLSGVDIYVVRDLNNGKIFLGFPKADETQQDVAITFEIKAQEFPMIHEYLTKQLIPFERDAQNKHFF